MQFAEELNLDLGRFQEDMSSEEVRKRIAADVALGNTLRVPATPGVLLDGRPLSGNKLQPMFWTLLRTLDRISPATLARMQAVSVDIARSATAEIVPATSEPEPSSD